MSVCFSPRPPFFLLIALCRSFAHSDATPAPFNRHISNDRTNVKHSPESSTCMIVFFSLPISGFRSFVPLPHREPKVVTIWFQNCHQNERKANLTPSASASKHLPHPWQTVDSHAESRLHVHVHVHLTLTFPLALLVTLHASPQIAFETSDA